MFSTWLALSEGNPPFIRGYKANDAKLWWIFFLDVGLSKLVNKQSCCCDLGRYDHQERHCDNSFDENPHFELLSVMSSTDKFRTLVIVHWKRCLILCKLCDSFRYSKCNHLILNIAIWTHSTASHVRRIEFGDHMNIFSFKSTCPPIFMQSLIRFCKTCRRLLYSANMDYCGNWLTLIPIHKTQNFENMKIIDVIYVIMKLFPD